MHEILHLWPCMFHSKFLLNSHGRFRLFGLYILPCVSSVGWSVKLLLVLANIVILLSGSHGIHYHIFLSHHYEVCATTLLVLRVALGQVRLGKLLLDLTSTVILGSGSCGTHDRIFLSHDSGVHWPSVYSFNRNQLMCVVCCHGNTYQQAIV
jgi:hypothetical protein